MKPRLIATGPDTYYTSTWGAYLLAPVAIYLNTVLSVVREAVIVVVASSVHRWIRMKNHSNPPCRGGKGDDIYTYPAVGLGRLVSR